MSHPRGTPRYRVTLSLAEIQTVRELSYRPFFVKHIVYKVSFRGWGSAGLLGTSASKSRRKVNSLEVSVGGRGDHADGCVIVNVADALKAGCVSVKECHRGAWLSVRRPDVFWEKVRR